MLAPLIGLELGYALPPILGMLPPMFAPDALLVDIGLISLEFIG
jgi:hypothetical protein